MSLKLLSLQNYSSQDSRKENQINFILNKLHIVIFVYTRNNLSGYSYIFKTRVIYNYLGHLKRNSTPISCTGDHHYH